MQNFLTKEPQNFIQLNNFSNYEYSNDMEKNSHLEENSKKVFRKFLKNLEYLEFYRNIR